MKKYYDLIGNESPLESWVLTYKDYPPTLPQIEFFNQMLTAASWPVLYYEQIPARFLMQDPGVPILLRNEVKHPVPEWIHPPLLPDSQNLSGRYFIQTPNNRKPTRVLFSLAHFPESNWEELCRKYPAEEHRWIWNAEKNSKPELISFPEECKLGMGDIVYLRQFSPDLLVDLSFGLSDTYTPIHLFCLHYGCDLELFKAPQGLETVHTKDLNRSKWLIYK